VRETGFTEKTDLKESLIGHAPLYLVSWQDWKSEESLIGHAPLYLASWQDWKSAQRALVSYEVDYLLGILKNLRFAKKILRVPLSAIVHEKAENATIILTL
jgi:hypothetical protein